MTLKKKIIVWAIVTIIGLPGVLMLFNDNEDTVYFNIIGLAYLWIAVKACQRLMPQWMKDYLEEGCGHDDNFED